MRTVEFQRALWAQSSRGQTQYLFNGAYARLGGRSLATCLNELFDFVKTLDIWEYREIGLLRGLKDSDHEFLVIRGQIM